MKITNVEVFVLGDPKPDHAIDMARVDGLAFVRIHTDEGLTGGTPTAVRTAVYQVSVGDRLQRAGVGAEAGQILAPAPVEVQQSDPSALDPEENFGARYLFAMALVIMLVRARLLGMDRSLLEASSDLYATPWGTFRQVTLPMILPAVIAGFLLSFTFSLDDYVVASFVAGPTVTLPIYIFASVRRGVTPEINAIGTVVLSVSLLLLFGSLLLLRRGQRAGGVASKA